MQITAGKVSEMQQNEIDKKQCPICQEKEVNKLRSDLAECKKRNQSKERRIKNLDKKVFILTIIIAGVGAIFGKEAVEAISEWISSFNQIRSSIDDLSGLTHPSPGALSLFAITLLASGSRKRRC